MKPVEDGRSPLRGSGCGPTASDLRSSQSRIPNAEPYPAHIRDNPVMQIAFRDFMHWLWAQEPAHEAFRAATGMPSIRKGLTSPIERKIGEATGFMAEYAAAFTRWAVENHWGAEDSEGEPQ